MDVLKRLVEKHGDMKSACEALDISPRTARYWKSGSAKISKRNAEKIAKDLNLSIKTVKTSIDNGVKE